METPEFAAMFTAKPSRSMRSAWLPILLSCAVHAIVFLPFFLYWTTREAADGQQLPFDAVVIDDGVTLSLLPEQLALKREDKSQRNASTSEKDTPARVEATTPPPNAPSIEHGPTASSLPATAPSTGQATPSAVGGYGSSTGSAAVAGFFGLTTPGKSFIFVVDRSLSMGVSRAFPRAKRELLATLERLPPGAKIQIILYNKIAEPICQGGSDGLVTLSEEIRSQIASLLDDARAEGGTAHLPALRQALELEPDVIFFVTDADDLRIQDIQAVTRQNQGRSIINAIEISPGGKMHRPGPLALLAAQNRGNWTVVPCQ